MEAKVLSYNEKRLARLYRQAALQHVRRELGPAGESLAEAVFLLEGEPRLEPVLCFTREWATAVSTERKGLIPPAAPAAWIHLGQELASLLETGGDGVAYLGTRWRIEAGRIGWSRRLFYGILSAAALVLSTLIALMLARHAASGSWEGLGVGGMSTPFQRILALALLFGRVAGTVLMVEHGILWAKRAISGRVDEPRILFLGGGKDLALVESPSR